MMYTLPPDSTCNPRPLRWIALWLAALVLSLPLYADLPIVRNAKPMSVIIIPEDAGDVTETAARELQIYIKKISGASIPIQVEESMSLPDLHWLDGRYTIISIGHTRMAKAQGFDTSKLKKEGFYIESKLVSLSGLYGSKLNKYVLFILGREDRLDTTKLRSTGWLTLHWPIRRRGTLFGVYTFLEEHLGVRWLWPGESGEVIPTMRDISIPEIKQAEQPALPIRIFRPGMGSGAIRTHALKIGEPPESMLQRTIQTNHWTQRMRLGNSFVIDQTHTYGTKFWNKHSKDHPEWFAMQPDGARMKKHPKLDRVRLCYSNTQLHQAIAQMTMDKIRLNPAVSSFSVCLDDVSRGTAFCQCKPCQDYGPTLTDRVMRFSSDVGRIVSKTYPDKRVTQFAYAQWNQAPITNKVHPSVVISYVGTYTHGYLYTPDRISNRMLWDSWAKMVDGKMLWRPNLPVSLGVPVVLIHEMAEDLRQFSPNTWGADIDFLEGSWASRGLDWYVFSKLLWDPDQDVDALIDDYCQSGFGPAWKSVRAYFHLVEKYTQEIARLTPGHDYPTWAKAIPTFYTAQRIQALQELLNQAAELAKDNPKVQERIAFLQVPLDWTKISANAWQFYPDDKADKQQAKAAVQKDFDFLMKHRESYAIHSAYIASKITWMWNNYFGAKEMDWSQAN